MHLGKEALITNAGLWGQTTLGESCQYFGALCQFVFLKK